MKKSQKWVIILMIIIIPTITLTVSLMIAGISIKELPLWFIIGMPLLILVSPFLFLLGQRHAERIRYAPLRKRRKWILINLGIYITFTLIMFIILYLKLGRTPFQNKSVILLWFVPIPFMLYNLFFPKDEEQKDTSETKMSN